MALVLAKTILLSLGLNYGVHYTSLRLYDVYCIPHNLEEVVQSLVTSASPVCSFLLNAMTVTQNNYAVTVTSAVGGILRSG